jgi:hypothetical protein
VWIEVQLATVPVEVALGVGRGCLDCDDAKGLLGLLQEAEVR